MKQPIIIALLVMLSPTLIAQKKAPKVVNEYAAIDKKVLEMPDSLTKTTEGIAGFIQSNFNTTHEKTRAIFIWIATNIQYDIDNMFAINFYEKKEDKISKPLVSRKGICENYAALFNDVCLKAGIKSFVIEGYTKQNGFADYIPHAWCAAFIDSAWFMFDPTWGSGYISNNKFYRKINNDYYKAQPSALIKSHIPFDFLWQFVHYPVTNQEFYEGRTEQNKLKPFFNYTDSITAFEKQTRIEQLKSSVIRIEKNGVKNALIYDRLQHLKMEIETDRKTRIVDLYNSTAAGYVEGINKYNEFINYRNKQFIPEKTDAYIQSIIDSVDTRLKDVKTKLGEIKNADANVSMLIVQLTKSIDDAVILVKEQQEWLKIYFSKGKSKRKSMFYERKVSWFGIPLN